MTGTISNNKTRIEFKSSGSRRSWASVKIVDLGSGEFKDIRLSWTALAYGMALFLAESQLPRSLVKRFRHILEYTEHGVPENPNCSMMEILPNGTTSRR